MKVNDRDWSVTDTVTSPKECIEREATKHIKPNPVLGEWFDHGTDYITKYQALDIVAANNITTEMTLRCYDKIVDGIYKIPPADVKPVVRGEWVIEETVEIGGIWVKWCCDECGYVRTQGWKHTKNGEKPKAKYCENCGAEMRKEANDE